VPVESLSIVQYICDQNKHDEFSMKLKSKFKIIHLNLMNWDILPSLDICFRKLLCEEQRLLTQDIFKQENYVTITIAAQWKGMSRNKSNIHCYSYKEYWHIAINYRKKLCNYCKHQGHIIKEYPTHPRNHKINAFQDVVPENSYIAAESSILAPEMM